MKTVADHPRVSLLVISWNRKTATLKCLWSIKNQKIRAADYEVIVVDNHSNDGTINAIKKMFSDVKIAALDNNYGFAGAINRGAGKARGKYIIVLQSDTVLDRNYLKQILHTAGKYPAAGIIGPLVYYYRGLNSFKRIPIIEKAHGRIDAKSLELIHIGKGEPDTGQFTQVNRIESTGFCGVMIKKSVFKRVGRMDERFFHGFEDNDFLLRAQKQSVRFYLSPTARVWHRQEKSLAPASPRHTYYSLRGKLLLLGKHGRINLIQNMRNARFFLSSGLFFLFDKEKKQHYKAIMQAIADYYLQRFERRV